MSRMREIVDGLKGRAATALHAAADKIGRAGYKPEIKKEALQEKVQHANEMTELLEHPGFKHFMGLVTKQKDAYVQHLLHSKDRDSVDAQGFCARAAALDQILEWPMEVIREGEEAEKQLEELYGHA